MTVPFGWMYAPLERDKAEEIILITGKSRSGTINVGEEIIEIDLSKYHKGGVGPYSYSPGPQRLPDGVSVDSTSGKVTGVYSSAISTGVSTVIVKDSLGNTLTIQLSYQPGQIPLTFIKKTAWDFGYLE